MNPKFSIIVCFKNPNIDYFIDCLNSINNQLFKDFECIFINDFSNKDFDYLAFIKEKLNSIDIKYIENEINYGLGRSRDIGIINSDGQFILFLDSDDQITKDCLLYLDKKFKEYSYIDFISFNYKEVFPIGHKYYKQTLYVKKIEEVIATKNIVDDKFNRFFYDKFQTDWRICYRKSFLESNNICHRDEKVYFEDVVFNLMVKNYFNKVLLTTKILYIYNRCNPNSIVVNFGSQQSAQLILDNLKWVYLKLLERNQLNNNFYYFVIYFFRQFILINNDQQNWLFLKDLSKNNQFISRQYLGFKTRFMAKHLLLSKITGKLALHFVNKRDKKVKSHADSLK